MPRERKEGDYTVFEGLRSNHIAGPLFEGTFGEERQAIHMSASFIRWRYDLTDIHEIFPSSVIDLLTIPAGPEDHVEASAYRIVPVAPKAHNQVETTDLTGRKVIMQKERVGWASANVYLPDGLVHMTSPVLWPGFTDSSREWEDPNREELWVGFEHFLERVYGNLELFVIASGGNDQEAFLGRIGYTPYGGAGNGVRRFVKPATETTTQPLIRY